MNYHIDKHNNIYKVIAGDKIFIGNHGGAGILNWLRNK